MRTTIVTAICHADQLHFAHMGDSRGYLIRKGDILHLTQDHSVVMALHAGGQISYANIRTHPDRNRITPALGKDEEFNPSITPESIPLEKGDAILLCSDGLWEAVTDPEIIFDRCKTDDPEVWLKLLFERVMVKADTTHDNITGLAILLS